MIKSTTYIYVLNYVTRETYYLFECPTRGLLGQKLVKLSETRDTETFLTTANIPANLIKFTINKKELIEQKFVGIRIKRAP